MIHPAPTIVILSDGTPSITLTDNEVKLIMALRSLHPYEKITVNADKNGKPDNYLVERSYKEMWI
jgi:hypothetical protein